ncbi:trypsin-7-like [Planococcus citri]|uniref:trypsin-7-like n=1 Tax=Planococcus citri TaxID=170843 RepID=UPI0031F8D3FE
MYLASAIIFVNVIMIQLLQMPAAEGLLINRQFPAPDILHTPQRSIETVVSKCPKCDCRTNTRKKRIAGGIEAEENEFPWVAALRKFGVVSCGATVISKQHLLTAAHCVDGIFAIGTETGVEALLGGYYKNITLYDLYESKTVVWVGVSEIILHPGFNSSSLDNDIAILKLEHTISFNTPKIQPACLPSSGNENYAGYFGTVTGWGYTDKNKSLSTTNKMRKVEVPIISTNHCRINYSYIYGNPQYSVTDNMMCTGHWYLGGQGACKGDSGGPLQINVDGLGTMKVVGIVSWGGTCGDPDYPNVYTRIDRYNRWIHDNIGEKCLCKI